jgi:hypothetical protein
LKGAILNSFRPKGNTTKAENFVRFLFENGPGKYRNTWEIPGGTGLMDWYIAMANDATKVQANLIALRRAEGEPDLERMSTGSGTTGSTMSTSVTDRPLTPSRQFNQPSRDFMYNKESMDDSTIYNTGYNQSLGTRFEDKSTGSKGSYQYPPRAQFKASDHSSRASYPPNDHTIRNEQRSDPIQKPPPFALPPLFFFK